MRTSGGIMISFYIANLVTLVLVVSINPFSANNMVAASKLSIEMNLLPPEDNPTGSEAKVTNTFVGRAPEEKPYCMMYPCNSLSALADGPLCGIAQILIIQEPYSHSLTSELLVSDVPMYHVTVINNCLFCPVSNIHIACGDWASASGVDPIIFRRVSDNDCLLKNGDPLAPLESVYFEYANSFPYPMSVNGANSC